MTKPFLDFYSKIGFAPTGQQENKLQSHQVNRDNLYRKIGLHDAIFRGSSVLEIGPGSGENSFDLLRRGIDSLTLMDGIPAVLESIRSRAPKISNLNFIIQDVSTEFNTELYDIVVCEGVIPLQMDPDKFLINVATTVKPGGFLLITTMDEISLLSEVLRRYLAHKILSVGTSNLSEIVDFFSNDFDSLPGMTRKKEDWVLDTINVPWVGRLFSVADACKSSSSMLRPVALTPNICPDIAWYKSPLTAMIESSEWQKRYLLYCHNLIDSRTNQFLPASPLMNLNLQSNCNRIFVLVSAFTRREIEDPEKELIDLLVNTLAECKQLDSETILSIQAYIHWLQNSSNDLSDFRKLWGRGQQHLLFQKEISE